MKLLDFLQDEAFNQLRQRMGTQALGQFELFDPAKQLSWSEREALSTEGMLVKAGELRILKDKTVAFKNTRAWLYHEHHYHLSACPQVQALRHHNASAKIGTFNWSAKKDETVCLECLAVLQYQGIDTRRLRRTEFAEHISEQFSLQEFEQQYPFYPIV